MVDKNDSFGTLQGSGGMYYTTFDTGTPTPSSRNENATWCSPCSAFCCACLQRVPADLEETRKKWKAKFEAALVKIKASKVLRRGHMDSAFFIIARLFAHEDVVSKLYQYYDKFPADFRFYVPQLMTFLVHGLPENQISLEVFLMDKCERSLLFAHRVYWFLNSFAHNVRYTSEISGAIIRGRLVDSPLQAAVEVQGATAARRFIEYGPGHIQLSMQSGAAKDPANSMYPGMHRALATHREQPVHTKSDANMGHAKQDTRQAHRTSETQEDILSTPLVGGPGELEALEAHRSEKLDSRMTDNQADADEADKQEIKNQTESSTEPRNNSLGVSSADIEHNVHAPWSAITDEGLAAFRTTLDLVAEWIRLAYRLMQASAEDRNKQLRLGLNAINEAFLPSSSAYCPVGNPYNRLLNIHSEHSFCFKTKERVPYMMVLELVDLDPWAYGEGGAPFHEHYDSDDEHDHQRWQDQLQHGAAAAGAALRRAAGQFQKYIKTQVRKARTRSHSASGHHDAERLVPSQSRYSAVSPRQFTSVVANSPPSSSGQTKNPNQLLSGSSGEVEWFGSSTTEPRHVPFNPATELTHPVSTSSVAHATSKSTSTPTTATNGSSPLTETRNYNQNGRRTYNDAQLASMQQNLLSSSHSNRRRRKRHDKRSASRSHLRRRSSRASDRVVRKATSEADAYTDDETLSTVSESSSWGSQTQLSKRLAHVHMPSESSRHRKKPTTRQDVTTAAHMTPPRTESTTQTTMTKTSKASTPVVFSPTHTHTGTTHEREEPIHSAERPLGMWSRPYSGRHTASNEEHGQSIPDSTERKGTDLLSTANNTDMTSSSTVTQQLTYADVTAQSTSNEYPQSSIHTNSISGGNMIDSTRSESMSFADVVAEGANGEYQPVPSFSPARQVTDNYTTNTSPTRFTGLKSSQPGFHTQTGRYAARANTAGTLSSGGDYGVCDSQDTSAEDAAFERELRIGLTDFEADNIYSDVDEAIESDDEHLQHTITASHQNAGDIEHTMRQRRIDAARRRAKLRLAQQQQQQEQQQQQQQHHHQQQTASTNANVSEPHIIGASMDDIQVPLVASGTFETSKTEGKNYSEQVHTVLDQETTIAAKIMDSYPSQHSPELSQSDRPTSIKSRTDSSFGEERKDSEKAVHVAFPQRWKQKETELRHASPYGHLPGWRLMPVIIKSNDDLRQEQFVSQLLRQFNAIWRDASIPVWIKPYDILATARDGGLVEAIPDTISIDALKRGDPTFTTLTDFFQRYYCRGRHGEKRVRIARSNFCRSLAAYSIICYILQIKDRHNGNILLDANGHILHIDFGFLLTNSPGGNIGFEAAPFKLTQEFVDVLGGPGSRLFQYFRSLCVRAFLEARRHRQKLMLLVEMMLAGNRDLPCFIGGAENVIQGLQVRFQPDLSAQACVTYVNDLIDRSLNNWRTRWYDRYQRWAMGIQS